jgi:soluble lytic murein transglycosylase-like protein
VATGLSEIDLRFRRSRRQAAARHRRPRRRHPLAWRSVYAALLALAVLAVAAESTRLEGSSASTPAARLVAALALSPGCPVPAAFRAAFARASAQTAIPASLLVATAYEESRMDPRAHSGAGALGLLQVMPGTARSVGLTAYEPGANVLAGARYLRQLLNRYGDVDLALAAYNAGPTTIDRAGHAPVGSLRYAKNVEARAAVLSC